MCISIPKVTLKCKPKTALVKNNGEELCYIVRTKKRGQLFVVSPYHLENMVDCKSKVSESQLKDRVPG
jgi:hypothetical protein